MKYAKIFLPGAFQYTYTKIDIFWPKIYYLATLPSATKGLLFWCSAKRCQSRKELGAEFATEDNRSQFFSSPRFLLKLFFWVADAFVYFSALVRFVPGRFVPGFFIPRA
jgi:hypothetical protein